MISSSVAVLAVLVGLMALAEWLGRKPVLRHAGAALLVIVLTAVAVNVGLLPAYGPDTPVYAAVFDHVAPLAIFWLLLLVDLRSLGRVGGPSLALFLIGSAGTFIGALIAAATVGGSQTLGDFHAAIAGMYVGTYTGGSVNFNAVAFSYGVTKDGVLYAAAAAVDNVATTLWMAATVALPRLLRRWRPARAVTGANNVAVASAPDDETQTASVMDLAIIVALGFAAVAASDAAADWLQSALHVGIPSVLILTTLALVLAQIRWVQRLRGTRVLGLFAVYLFLAVIGTLCDVSALVRVGHLALVLATFVAIVIGVHALVLFGAARLLRTDADTAAVASQANIGGSTTALALARSLGRTDLELPAILVGSLGTAIGNYLGFLAASWLGAPT